MSILFPSSLDAFTARTDGPGQYIMAAHINDLQTGVVALETKLGIGASTPITNSVLAGTSAGVSGWTATPTLTSLTATTLTGTLATAAQPNITSLGTLTGLTVTGNPTIQLATAGSSAILTQQHTDGTNAASHAVVKIASGGAGGGDPYVHFLVTGALDWYAGVDNSDSDTFKIGSGGSTVGSGTVRLALATSGVASLGSPASTAGAGSGDLVQANNTGHHFTNQGGTATVLALGVNTSNEIVIGNGAADIRWSKPLVALGGGAAPTVGTIGGSGPAVAAQNTWMRVIDSAGVAFFIPAWK